MAENKDTKNEIVQQPKTASGTISVWLNNETITKQIVGALAGYMDADTFKAQCALAARDPNLAKCDVGSLFAAFLACAQMGLLPGKHHGHVYLIPRSGMVDVMPGASGYLHLMRKQPGVKDVRVQLVHTSDEFHYDADTAQITHRYDPFGEERIFKFPGKDGVTGLRGGYLRVEFEDGRVVLHFTPVAKILKNMQCAQSKNVWERWFSEMATKSVIRDAWARRVIHIDTELADRLGAAEDTDRVLLREDPNLVTVEVVRTEVEQKPAPKTGMASLKEKVAPKPEPAKVAEPAPEAEQPGFFDDLPRVNVCPSCKSRIDDMPEAAQQEILATGICPACPAR